METFDNLNNAVKKLKNFCKDLFSAIDINGLSLDLLRKSSTARMDFFNKYSFQLNQTDLSAAEDTLLTQYKIISRFDARQSKLTLTMKGMVMLEFDIDIDDEKNNKFLDELNRYYFYGLTEKLNVPLEAQEKGVIVALLGLLALSPDSAVKLSKFNDNYSNTEPFKECVNKSVYFLLSLGDEYKDNTVDKMWTLNVKGEDPVTARMSRLNSISVKTDNIYMKSGGGHYLNVLDHNDLNAEKLEFLLKRIFNQGFLNYEKREEFVKLLQSIFSERYKIIRNTPDFNQMDVKYLLIQKVMAFLQ